MTLQERRAEKLERDSSLGMSDVTMNGSWASKFDLISKTLHYFENKEAQSRKHSVDTTTTLNDGDMSRISTRKPSHATQTGTITSTHSGYNSRNTTIYSPSTHKLSIAAASINENELSLSSSLATTSDDPDAILPVPRTLSSENVYSHVPEITSGAAELAVPPPTSRSVFSVLRTHVIPLPLPAFFTRGKNSPSSSSHQAPSQSQSQSHSQSQNKTPTHPSNENSPSFPPTTNTLTTQIWSANPTPKGSEAGLWVPNHGPSYSSTYDYGAEEKYNQDDVLAVPKPGSRDYRERERREMVGEREEGEGVVEMERRKSEGLNVQREFEVVEERKSESENIDRAES
ncbi:a-factor receptor [Ciborinia camelliae]|nr:a-factor receptor [Ciborinia camelliae]